MGKLRASEGWPELVARIGGQKWAFSAAIRSPNGPSSEDDISFATPQISRVIEGIPPREFPK